mmetsp:Transcript_28653/g.42423  ORF Transcript_28653/g.42423 Transcript_28653/m.42423 type:complete len:90 (+) Transcript_28653:1319-1588(+)
MDHDGSPDDGQVTGQVDKSRLHRASGTARRVGNDVSEVTRMTLRSVTDVAMSLAMRVPVPASRSAAVAEVRLFVDMETMKARGESRNVV